MQKIKYFKNLTGLRFIASYTILIYHLQYLLEKNNQYNFKHTSFFEKPAGQLPVELFYVLSGFLITYLLLKEYKDTNTVNIRLFYIKRILRIWPPYYIVVILHLFIIPLILNKFNIKYDNALPYETFFWYVLMLPNVVPYFYWKNILQITWSIGVEEQFYLTWAPILKKYKKHFWSIVAVFFFVRYLILPSIKWDFFLTEKILFSFLAFADTLWFECMIVGCIGAYLFFNYGHTQYLKYFTNNKTQILCIILIAVFCLSNTYINSFWDNRLIHSIVFVIFIVNLTANDYSIINLENPVIKKLGEVSYGLYLYHTTVINIFILLMPKVFKTPLNPFVFQLVAVGFVTVVSIILALLSYKYIEKPILRLRVRFE